MAMVIRLINSFVLVWFVLGRWRTIGINQLLGACILISLDTRDFFTFRVPKGRELRSIKLNKYDNRSYGDNKGGGGWLAVSKGASIPDLNDPTGLIGGHLIGTAQGASAGDEILDDLEQEFQFGEAVVPALSPGQISGGKFTFWFQEGNFDTPNEAFVDYTFTFKFG